MYWSKMEKRWHTGYKETTTMYPFSERGGGGHLFKDKKKLSP